MKLFRHGDVLIAPAAQIPREAHQLPHLTLAEGELTGHAHRVVPRGRAELYGLDRLLFLRIIGDTADVTHEEHRPITLDPGIYRVWRQREYVPSSSSLALDFDGSHSVFD